MDPWRRLGLRALGARPALAAIWLALPLLGALFLGRHGNDLSPDTALLLALGLQMALGLWVYEIILRGAPLRVAAVLPTPATALRRALRRLLSTAVAGLGAATLMGALVADPSSPADLYPILLALLSLPFGVPMHSAVLAAASPDRLGQPSRLAQALGQNLLPGEIAPLVYGSAAAFGLMGAWLVSLHLALQHWERSSSWIATATSIGAGLGASTLAWIWFDRRGVSRLCDAAPRLAWLDRQGLLLATPHVKPSRSLLSAGPPAGAARLLWTQLLRRSPLLLPSAGAVLLLGTARGAVSHHALLAAAACAGLLLDLPSRWRAEGLLTTDAHVLLGAEAASGPSTGALLMAAFPAQLVAAFVLGAGSLLVGTGARVALLGAGALVGAALLSSLLLGPRLGARWSPLRGSLCVLLFALCVSLP